jgi:4-coumarate--CoA ligase
VVTKESLDYSQVKAKATTLSTVLVDKYGLQAGQTVSIFSTNTVWYAVALWATIRVGRSARELWVRVLEC